MYSINVEFDYIFSIPQGNMVKVQFVHAHDSGIYSCHIDNFVSKRLKIDFSVTVSGWYIDEHSIENLVKNFENSLRKIFRLDGDGAWVEIIFRVKIVI